jgi:protein-tyrosine phosphatase
VIRRALFVCTGNIFRSLTADVAVRRLLASREDIHVSSAGAEWLPDIEDVIPDYQIAAGPA